MDNADDELMDLIEIIRKAVSQHDKRLRRLESDADLDDVGDYADDRPDLHDPTWRE